MELPSHHKHLHRSTTPDTLTKPGGDTHITMPAA